MTVAVKVRSKDNDVFAPLNAQALMAFVQQWNSDILTPWRKGSLARALSAPTPTNKDEDFKYVNFRLLDFSDLNPEHLRIFGNDNGIPATVQMITSEGGAILPERLILPTSNITRDYANVFFGSFDDAAMLLPEELAASLDFFNTHFPPRKFAHLAHAFLSQGVYLHVCRNGALEAPRQIYTLTSGNNTMTSLASTVILEDNARAELVWDALATVDAKGFQNGTLDIVLKPGSKLSLLLNQEYTEQLNSVMTLRAYLEKDSELELVTLNSGGRLNQMEIDLQFAGEGSKVTVSGVYVGRNAENFNLLTHQDHRVGHCKSDLLYIGTLAGTSNSNYLGKITIAPKAQRSDAYQKNRNLVLNKGVSVNSSPKLEIGANDVRCTHGSTTARISDLEMFYLRSRGIDKGTVKMLLADGFLKQAAERVQSSTLKQAYERRLSALLSNWGKHDL
jgi:Fe-S cluster assembly protein SufD